MQPLNRQRVKRMIRWDSGWRPCDPGSSCPDRVSAGFERTTALVSGRMCSFRLACTSPRYSARPRLSVKGCQKQRAELSAVQVC